MSVARPAMQLLWACAAYLTTDSPSGRSLLVLEMSRAIDGIDARDLSELKSLHSAALGLLVADSSAAIAAAERDLRRVMSLYAIDRMEAAGCA